MKIVAAVISFALALSAAGKIENVQMLFDELTVGSNKKVGFFSQANYKTVAHFLPSDVEVVISDNQLQLENWVASGEILAACISGVPNEAFDSFPAGVISPRTMFGRKDSHLLMRAIDAAIVRVIEKGIHTELGRENKPFRVMEVNTCQAIGDWHPFPTSEEASAERWFQDKKVLVGALGPYDWSVDGNYQADPPTGYWPGFLKAVEDEFKAMYDPDFKFERVYDSSSQAVFDKISNKETDVTEPYYIVHSSYNGIGRSVQFAMSCLTGGSDSTFFVKKPVPEELVDDLMWHGLYGGCDSYAAWMCSQNENCNHKYCDTDKGIESYTETLAKDACKASCGACPSLSNPAKPACSGDSATFNAGYGPCDSYHLDWCLQNPEETCNKDYCVEDGAHKVCPHCGKCLESGYNA